MVRYDWHTRTQLDVWRHDHNVNCVAYCPTSRAVFSGSRDKTVRQWAFGRPDAVQEFAGHTLVVTGLAVRGDGTWLASGSRDYSFRVWDVATGKQLSSTALEYNMITDLKWLPHDPLVVQTGEDLTMRIWDARTGTVAQSFPPTRCFPLACDVSHDGFTIVSSFNGFDSDGCGVVLWDRRMLRQIREMTGHVHAVHDCCFLPPILGAQSRVASCAKDGSVRVWDTTTFDCVAMYSIPEAGALTSIAATSTADSSPAIIVGCDNHFVSVLQYDSAAQLTLLTQTSANA